MYRILKQVAKKIVPKKFMVKYEMTLRSILYLLYKGTRYECPVCNRKLRSFILMKDGEKLCPSCGSLPRNRRLWMLLNSGILKNHHHVLHFSPSKSLYGKLHKYPGIAYHSTDISGDFVAQKHLDITGIDEPDEEYDLIICYHILEHVEKDLDAIRELYRILKPGGICMIQTPFREGSIYENTAIESPSDRKVHFGQEDHVRVYSVKGLKSRLEQTGFVVEILTFAEDEDNYFGFKTDEFILIAKRNQNVLQDELTSS